MIKPKNDPGAFGPLPSLLTISDVARLLNMSRPTVYRLIDQEGLPVTRLGNRIPRVSSLSLHRWLADRER